MREVIVILDYRRSEARSYHVEDGRVSGRPAHVSLDDINADIYEATEEGWFVTQHVIGRAPLPEPAYDGELYFEDWQALQPDM